MVLEVIRLVVQIMKKMQGVGYHTIFFSSTN